MSLNSDLKELVEPLLRTIGIPCPDGAAFDGNRYVDRYVVSRGKNVAMDARSDSAEWMVAREGLGAL